MEIFLSNFIYALARVLDIAISILIFLIIAQALISWVQPNPYNPIVRFLNSAVEPLLYPIRRHITRHIPLGGIDISPMIAILVLFFLRIFVVQSLFELARRF
jgi:YggT family protein